MSSQSTITLSEPETFNSSTLKNPRPGDGAKEEKRGKMGADLDDELSAFGSHSMRFELCATILRLIEETKKRRTAEEDLAMMCAQWQRIGKLLLSHTDLTFLAPSNDSITPMELDINAMEQFSQEVIVTRFVAEAMGKAEAQAEAELAAEVIIKSKDEEISRLQSVIHEMSQKNVESMEVTRRQQERKRRQRTWLWSCIGISIVIGANVIAWSYAPQEPLLVIHSQKEGSWLITLD